MTATTLKRYMRKRPGSVMWQLRKPVPADVQDAFGHRVITRTLGTSDDRAATRAAIAILDDLEVEWALLRQGQSAARQSVNTITTAHGEPPEPLKRAIIRALYEQVSQRGKALDNEAFTADRAAYSDNIAKRRTKLGEVIREVRAGQLERFAGPIERTIVRHGVEVDRDAPWLTHLIRDAATAVLDARNVSIRADEGEIDPRPTSEVVKRAFDEQGAIRTAKDVPFVELVEQFMRQWLAGRGGGKVTNTEQQKLATFRLFGGFFENQPIRQIRHEDAATFFDHLRLFDPNWARSPGSRRLAWPHLVERYRDRASGLSDATMNRHFQVLQEIWAWARMRGHCGGENPFEGFHKRLRAGVNVKPYVAWEINELRQLLTPTPKRADLLEVMIVGMFTGMRLDEVASLTWGQIRSSSEDGETVDYFQVEDAKTPAGNRKVPVHRDLGWLLSRRRGDDADRVWPTFNKEGPSKKPGADAGREFSTFKISRGFKDRTKVFHSFRKNVTGMMERAGVPENDWAQIFGHERGFTYAVYSPGGISMRRRAEIIDLIAYPNIAVPHPTG
jgi:integrase